MPSPHHWSTAPWRLLAVVVVLAAFAGCTDDADDKASATDAGAADAGAGGEDGGQVGDSDDATAGGDGLQGEDAGDADGGDAQDDGGTAQSDGEDAASEDAAAADTAAADTAAADTAAEDTAAADTASEDAAGADAAGEDAASEDAGDAAPSCPPGCVNCAPDGSCGDLKPCAPALTLTPAKLTTLPYELTTFTAKGGTGAYVFKLAKDGSGALLNPYAGTYLSGEKVGTSDVIALSDTGCVGAAEATVTVVDAMVVAPQSAEVAPGESFTYVVGQGSGAFAFKMQKAPSGGSVTAKGGVYTAGKKIGDDVVRITDTATGEQTTATVAVRANAKLVATPATIALPLGAKATLGVEGGSGAFVLNVPKGPLTQDGPLQVVADAVGQVVLSISDAFLNKAVTVAARAVATFSHSDGPVGDSTQQATLVAPGDLDGDGHPELLLGLPESDLSAYNAGAVFVWRGDGKSGVGPAPWVTLVGGDRDARLGWSLAAADLDGDGKVELLAGAPLDDVGAGNNGAVHIYGLQNNGKPATKPKATLAGLYGSDQAGSAVAVCDFNGDGWLDVAVGAPYAEDRKASPVVNDTGGVYVWLGSAKGLAALSDKPSFARYGQVPDGKGAMVSEVNSRVGWSLAAGDFDGDGACDLAVGSLYYKDLKANDGLVLVYRGVKAKGGDAGGLAAAPARAISGGGVVEVGSQLGRSMAACDLDGDGKDELVVGQLNYRGGDGKVIGRGATRVFAAAGLGAPAAKLESAESAVWTATGTKAYDYHGYRVACFDADGDGLADVVTQLHSGELQGGVNNAGVLAVYAGKKGAWPGEAPSASHGGLAGGDSFGLAAATLGDLDKDGKPELVVYAGLDDSLGYDLGRTYVLSSKTGAVSPLTRAAVASGARFGSALAFVGDLDGDGFEELAIGAGYASPTKGDGHVATRAGATWIAPGTAAGVDMSKAVALVGFTGHSGSDLLGWSVDRAGDFDGDGLGDVAVVARSEDRPANFNTSYLAPKACGGAANNVGAVYVFGGNKGALPSATPRFVGYGPQDNAVIETVLGDLDVDGDGKRDVVVGGPSWDAPGRTNAGGWGVYYGRATTAGKITVACEPDFSYVGDNAGDALGRALGRVGDLDGDGCDEFAVGASGADNGLSNQGAVVVVFGWGKGCKSNAPRAFALRPGVANAALGYGVAGGHDVDGDGKPDLVVGGINYAHEGKTVGAVWLVRSAWLAAQKPAPLVDGKPPGVIVGLADVKEPLVLGVHGAAVAGRYGWSLALVPKLEADGRAGVLVGAPLGAVGGVLVAGGAELLRFSKIDGLSPVPLLGVVGDSARPGAQRGYAVAARAPTKGGGGAKPVLAVGSLYGTPKGGATLDQGDVLVTPLP